MTRMSSLTGPLWLAVLVAAAVITARAGAVLAECGYGCVADYYYEDASGTTTVFIYYEKAAAMVHKQHLGPNTDKEGSVKIANIRYYKASCKQVCTASEKNYGEAAECTTPESQGNTQTFKECVPETSK